MNTLIKFKTMTDKAYNQATSLFIGEKAGDNQELFYNWVANSVYKYFEHKDATHLNRAVQGCKQRSMAFVSVAKRLSCHQWSVDKQAFIGKMSKGDMVTMLNVNDNDVPEFEVILLDWMTKVSERISHEGKAKETTAMTIEQADKRIDSFMRKAGESGLTIAQVEALFTTKLNEYKQSMVAQPTAMLKAVA